MTDLQRNVLTTVACVAAMLILSACSPLPPKTTAPAQPRTSNPSLVRLSQSYLESVETTSDAGLKQQLFWSQDVSAVQVTWAGERPRNNDAPGGVMPGASFGGFDVAVAYKDAGVPRKAYLYLTTINWDNGTSEVTEARCEIKEWKRRLKGLTAEQVAARLGSPEAGRFGRQLYEVQYGDADMLLEIRFKHGVVDDMRFVYPDNAYT